MNDDLERSADDSSRDVDTERLTWEDSLRDWLACRAIEVTTPA
jgi:hypothetical protein